MNSFFEELICGFILIAFLIGIFALGVWCGISQGEYNEQEKAVKLKSAEYYLDENNIKQFRYKFNELTN